MSGLNMLLKHLQSTDTWVGALVGCVVSLLAIGYLSYPYVQAIGAIEKNKKRIKEVRKNNQVQSQKIRNINDNLEELNRTMKIIACSNEKLQYTARNLLNCTQFEHRK